MEHEMNRKQGEGELKERIRRENEKRDQRKKASVEFSDRVEKTVEELRELLEESGGKDLEE